MATPTTPTDADRIAAAGVALALVDGSEVRLRFDLGALHRLEQEFGSIAATAEALHAMWTGALDSSAPWAGTLRAVLAAALPNVASDAYADPPLVLTSAVGVAWLEAFPAPDPKG